MVFLEFHGTVKSKFWEIILYKEYLYQTHLEYIINTKNQIICL